MRPCGSFRTDYGKDMALIQSKTQWSLLAAFLGLLCLLPHVLAPSWLTFMIGMLITIIAVLGLNIVSGMAGQFNLGQAAFVLVGGYAAAILGTKADLPFLAVLPLSGLIAGLMGILIGFSSLRLMGFYLAVATFAFHELVVYGIRHGGDFTGGVRGIYGVPDASIAGFALDTDGRMFYLILLVVVALVVLSVNIVRSRIGRAFEGIKQNPMATASMGVNIYRYKLLAFFLGSAIAGLAGCLLVYYHGFVNHDMVSVWDSIWYLGMMIVGGWGSTLGAIMGVVSLDLVKKLIVTYGRDITSVITFLEFDRIVPMVTAVYGLIVILFVSFLPHGLVYVWHRVKGYYRQWPL